jgi:hypothetical protein
VTGGREARRMSRRALEAEVRPRGDLRGASEALLAIE